MHHDASVPAAARSARQGGPAVLAEALRAARRDTLAAFAAYERALPGLRVPMHAELNPPLWELGHVGWFQAWWVARNPARARGEHADPDAPRAPSPRAGADALYHSGRVPHDTRWALPLPDADATRADLAAQLDETLALLAALDGPVPASDDALYFFRLALLHEDMHHEAALYMARALGVPMDDPRWQPRPLPDPPPPVTVAAGTWALGAAPGEGFAFDNERGRCEVALADAAIDAQVVRWAEYLPFVEAGGYEDPRWWTPDGLAWLAAQPERAPRYLRRDTHRPHGSHWSHGIHGRWEPLDLSCAAVHLSLHEAEAWCRWAGRRLPTEAEWERAALTAPETFRWGDAWEWTASAFAPFPGFCAHPYRDYSAPWFDGRPVLRGASPLTQPRMRHPRYRNFFPAGRNDVPAGFRSCRTGT